MRTRRRRRRGRISLTVLLAVCAVGAFAAGWSISRPPHAVQFHCTDRRGFACVAVGGRLLSARRSDGDGDGDRHLILSSRSSLSVPGITVVKVARNMDADLDHASFGTWVTATGYVYRGTSGFVELRAWRLGIGSGR